MILINERYKLIDQRIEHALFFEYKAFDCLKKEHVLLRMSKNGCDAAFGKSLMEQAFVLKSLRCENTQRLKTCGFDFGHKDHVFGYLVMEEVSGSTLHDYLIKHGPLSPGVCVSLLRQILSSLREAHSYGIFHCNLKTKNILFYKEHGQYRVKVLNFGTALDLSNMKCAFYTPSFAAPEQMFDVKEIGAYTDLYALGLILLHCLGCSPWQHRTTTEIVALMQMYDYPPLNSGLREGTFGALLSGLLLKNVHDSSKPMRLKSCSQVLAQLEQIEEKLK